MAKLSLAQQVAQLDSAASADADPEDIEQEPIDAFELESFPDITNVGREHYLEVGPSSIRKLLHDVSDPRYEGRPVSRKDLLTGELAQLLSETEDEGANGELPEDSEGDVSRDTEESDEEENGKNQMDIENLPPGSEYGEIPAERLISAGPLRSAKDARLEERRKGQAVVRQQALWNTLLGARIRLQPLLLNVNRLPDPPLLQTLSSSENCSVAIKRFLNEACGLSQDISELRRSLLTGEEGLQLPPRKKPRLEQKETFIEQDSTVLDTTEEKNILEEGFHPHLIQTLNKWSAKINAVSPSTLLSSRNAFRPRSSTQPKNAPQLIEEILRDEKVVGRTRLLRNAVARVGIRPEEQSGSMLPPETIFDDTDFYHQLLRDVVEGKKGVDGISQDVGLKPPKVKKKVDTKASKGRKIRYNVHEKLQNFMVPISVASWHEEQIDEFFASLLGKGFNTNTQPSENGDTNRTNSIFADGFKIFG